MPDVTKDATGRCLECGGYGSAYKSMVEVKIDAVKITLCESCAKDLRDELIVAVSDPNE